jgi:hypothetical protein
MASSWEEEIILELMTMAMVTVSSWEEERMHFILQELETKAMVSSWEEERMHLIYRS